MGRARYGMQCMHLLTVLCGVCIKPAASRWHCHMPGYLELGTCLLQQAKLVCWLLRHPCCQLLLHRNTALMNSRKEFCEFVGDATTRGQPTLCWPHSSIQEHTPHECLPTAVLTPSASWPKTNRIAAASVPAKDT